MKILHLHFKNLNSLAGTWDIDFTHPDFVSSGIFAITGPTGAGKTTILDAICLALYGQTPRLVRITQSENEIMSRQTGECFAEVEFETIKGRFRCHWSQHRSRKQADGQLQSPKHEIVAADSSLILESKLKAVASRVEDVTGMDFDRFTRSMLLAQGGFAAFLQARPDERAPILEQITGTAIYSRISVKVHERTSEERKRAGEMRAELDSMQLLTPTDAEILGTERNELQQSAEVLGKAVLCLRDAQMWRERIVALEGEFQQLNLDRAAFGERKAAAAADLEQLALAGRALKLGGDHAQILLLRKQQGVEQVELVAATESHPRLQQVWQNAFDALATADSELARIRIYQDKESELIRLTRVLDVKLDEVRMNQQGITAEIEKTRRQSNEHYQELTTFDQRTTEIDAALLTVTDFITDHQVDAGLNEALTGIEQQLSGLKLGENQSRSFHAALAQQVNQVENSNQLRSQAEVAWQTAQNAFIEAEQHLAVVRTAQEALLVGRDASALRDEVETLSGRLAKLGLLHESVFRLEAGRKQQSELKVREELLELKRQETEQREKTLRGECELRERVVRQGQDNVILLNRVHSLEDDRKHLVDGVPCPLCGASEHPYAADAVPQLDDAQNELELAIFEAKMAREQHSRTALDAVIVTKDLQQLRVEQTELLGRQIADELFCTNSFTELVIFADRELWPEIIRCETETCRNELASSRTCISEVEQIALEERSALGALTALQEELALQDTARVTAGLRYETAVAERKRLEGECAGSLSNCDRIRAEVVGTVAVYGYREVTLAAVDEILVDLTKRRAVYATQLQARDRLERERAGCAAETAKLRAMLAESEKIVFEKDRLLREKTIQRDALIEERLELYGERNPDVEEKQLNDAVRQAGERRETALQELHCLQAELGGLNQQIERMSESVAQRKSVLFELEAAFILRLGEAGFATEADFVRACISHEHYEELARKAERLRADETALLTRQQDCMLLLESERDKKLTDKPLELIQEENTALTGQLIELQKSLGALDHKLQQYDELHQRHQSRFFACELQKQECERWERLHSLIGSSDGKKFRNFAQGLTFELMVVHANRQLQKMSDRYILVRDSNEPLELNVIDNYQAGEIRSTKNLSGGESFIASLALSLGLSSMASNNVRVDSLFLDEGFGTLDEDALETALETLSGLQQDGKLIGIISHVPALKERIGTQIQVENGSTGHSSLSGPGCRRVL